MSVAATSGGLLLRGVIFHANPKYRGDASRSMHYSDGNLDAKSLADDCIICPSFDGNTINLMFKGCSYPGCLPCNAGTPCSLRLNLKGFPPRGPTDPCQPAHTLWWTSQEWGTQWRATPWRHSVLNTTRLLPASATGEHGFVYSRGGFSLGRFFQYILHIHSSSVSM